MKRTKSQLPTIGQEVNPLPTEVTYAMEQYLAAYPSCRDCGAKATLVELKDSSPKRMLDRANFKALCKPCHDSKTTTHGKGINHE